jgi:hypothetical protein
MTEPVDFRGRKEICSFLRVRTWKTAKKELQRLGCLDYDGTKPLLVLAKYRDARLRNK